MDASGKSDDQQPVEREIAELKIEGETTPISSRFSLRFLEHPDKPATPVLYFDGRRVIRAWSIEISHCQPVDPWGISGGRD